MCERGAAPTKLFFSQTIRGLVLPCKSPGEKRLRIFLFTIQYRLSLPGDVVCVCILVLYLPIHHTTRTTISHLGTPGLDMFRSVLDQMNEPPWDQSAMYVLEGGMQSRNQITPMRLVRHALGGIHWPRPPHDCQSPYQVSKAVCYIQALCLYAVIWASAIHILLQHNTDCKQRLARLCSLPLIFTLAVSGLAHRNVCRVSKLPPPL
ncbi:hypothetical protein GGI42DRAFT_249917 [Trichoderma sp. SZMC 28013]